MDKLLATCGFSIETSSEDVIKQNAAETGVTDLDWDKVNEDMQIVESAMLKWLDTMFGSARDEGHGSDDSLIGTLFIYRNLDIVKDSLDIGEPLRTGSGTLQLPEMNLTYPELIDISVDFFDLVEEKVEAGKGVVSSQSLQKVFNTSYTGYDNKIYPAKMTIEKEGDKYTCLGYSYYDGEEWVDTEERSVVSQQEMSELWGESDIAVRNVVLAVKKVTSYKQTGTYSDKELLLTDHKAVLRDMKDSDGAFPTNRVDPDNPNMEYSESAVLMGVPIEIFYTLTEEDQTIALETGDEGQIDWLSCIDKIKVDLYNCDRRGTTDSQIDAVIAKYNFGVESMRRNASAWSKEQADEVAELDAEFDAFLASEGIDPNSKEASDAWKEGYQDRMKKIFASKSVTSAKEMGVEVIVDDDQEPNDRFIEVTDMLQARYDSMKSENPDLDTADFDAELGTVALEIADEIGARLSVKDGRYIFDFTTEPAPLVKLPEPSEDSFKDEDFEDVF